MSWVDLHGIPALSGVVGGDAVLADFLKEVEDPVMLLLARLSSGGHAAHGPAFRALAAYAPEHQLPHLGMRLTRSALGRLGVNVATPGSGLPAEAVRAECWSVGVW